MSLSRPCVFLILLLSFLCLFLRGGSCETQNIDPSKNLNTTSQELLNLEKEKLSEGMTIKTSKKKYNLGRDAQRSMLQLKYAAEEYYDDGEHMDDTSGGEVNTPMRDIPYNGFTAVVGVGTPPQTFYCIFDTGSSVMFVNSFTCENENCDLNPQFLEDKSETYDDSEAFEESLMYGGGYLDGKVIRDSVFIETMELTDQDIALVTSEDDGSTPNFSCVIGLSFPDLAPQGETLLFDNMINQNLLNQNLFTTYYYPDRDHADLHFGGIIDDYYEGEIHYVPIQKQEHWNIRIDDILVGGVSTGICDTEFGCQGLVDTGTNSNSIEIEYWDTLNDMVFEGTDFSDGWDCSRNDINLPDISYVIDGQTYDFSWQEWSDGDMGYCYIDMFDMQVFEDPQSPSLVLGVSFLRKYFTVWDRTDPENPMIGFALGSDLSVPTEEFAEVDGIEDHSPNFEAMFT